MPPIARYMTSQPWTVQPGDSVAAARDKMREHAIRHLPVIDDGELVGIVSDRDLRLLWHGLGLRVRDVMTEQVLVIRPDAPIDEVAEAMSERKCGSAVIVEDGKVLGIFTSVDACRALADALRRAVA
ncbi:MAG TPA: CBS domain-containing protein [Kofleriaceae bacterium]|nr:CBS domain-containing protein [Kofleriaceae bacterium]